MPPPGDLRAFVSVWLDRYPDPDANSSDNRSARASEEKRLNRFIGMASLSQADARELVGWKFNSMAHRRANALKGVDDVHWPHANERIRAALAAEGDLLPLTAMASVRDGVWGWGPAMSSMILAVCFPKRFTIADTKALSTVRALDFPVPTGGTFGINHWEPYLAACRQIAEECDRTLREVDQALWAADGKPYLAIRGT
jgi:hypothetical protein